MRTTHYSTKSTKLHISFHQLLFRPYQILRCNFIITTLVIPVPVATMTSASIMMKMALLSSLVLMKSAKSFQLAAPNPSIFNAPSKSNAHPRTSSALTMSTEFGHDYKRDTSDTSNVDLNAVNKLLGDRLYARKTGDFVSADKIRDQLSADYMVTVFDQDKMWATGSGGTNRGGRSGRGSGRGNPRGDTGRGGRGRGGGGNTMNREPMRRNFGPNGHDYNVCTEAGPISSQMAERSIHNKVAERLVAKMNRDFETADRVQLELAEEGVFINDRTKEWRADGVRFIDPSEGRRTPADRNRPYVQSGHSLPLSQDAKYTHERIAQLVSERSQCKQDNDFKKADSIRDALEKACNVVIDDRVREWSIGGSFGKDSDIKRAHSIALKSRNYARSSASLDLPDGVTEEVVQAKVDARATARSRREYRQSDVMRDEILEKFGVTIHDTIKMWSVGGEFGSDDPVKARAEALKSYTRRGGGNLSEDDVVLIQAMLTKRFEAKRVRNFNEADEIRSHLYTTYNVNVNDQSREWRVLSDDYVQTQAERGAKELTTEEVSIIEKKIVKRATLKKNKSYEEADAIRDELESTYSVLIDDKTKEWKVVSSGNSKFAVESARSQSSSYKEQRIEKDFDEEFSSIFTTVKDDAAAADTTVVADLAPEEEEDTSSPITVDISIRKAPSRDELVTLTVPSLKEMLREAGMPVSGKKAELIDRLLA